MMRPNLHTKTNTTLKKVPKTNSNSTQKGVTLDHVTFNPKQADLEFLETIATTFNEFKTHLRTELITELKTAINPTNKIIINTGDECHYTPVEDIILCKADGNYTKVYTTTDCYFTSKSLKHYETLLKSKRFLKPHRSVLINEQHIVSIYKRESILMSNQEQVIISHRNKNVISEFIKQNS